MSPAAIRTLRVWVRREEKVRLAGEIRVSGPDPLRGALTGAFRYDKAYLQDPTSFPLDPVHLPLAETVFAANRPLSGVHGVFEDALPDDWGRALLVREFNLAPKDQRAPQLLECLGGRALGALVFSSGKSPQLEDSSGDLLTLEDLLLSAQQYERSGILPEDPRVKALLRAGSSPGGARPKALVRDAQGVMYLAKFPSVKDRLDMVRIEAASLALATLAGLPTPDTSVVACGSHPVLLSRRFDVSHTGGRCHILSFQTLLNAQGYYASSYAEMADVLGRVSAKPLVDLAAFYRQIVFNALLGHTDDHLKNFLMRQDGTGYRLAPAFDLAPDVAGRYEHVLSFGQSGFSPTLASLTRLGTICRLSPDAAREIRAEVWQAVAGWERVFAQAGVPELERQQMARDIQQRLQTLGHAEPGSFEAPSPGQRP